MKNVRHFPNCYKRRGRMSLLIYAISLLLLMLVSPLALAGPNCEDHPNNPKCNGGGGGGSPDPFSAVIIDHFYGIPRSDIYAPGWDCESIARTQKDFNINITDDSCATLQTSDGTFITKSRYLNVLKDESGAIYSVWLFGQSTIDGEVRAHISDEMMLGPPLLVDSFPDGSFIIHVHATNVGLTKCDEARIKRHTVCDQSAGTFAIDDLVYFPTP